MRAKREVDVVDTATQRRVLVVEDEPTIAESVAARLRAEGFAVEVAGDGPGAVAAARRTQPDAVVLDVMLPDGSGLDLCRRIRRGEAAWDAATAVLVLSARAEEVDLLRSFERGADEYVLKATP